MEFDLKSRVRDRNQLEVTLIYSQDKYGQNVKRQQLDLDFFLFTPKHLGITNELKKKRGKQLFTNYMRLASPLDASFQNCELDYSERYLSLGSKMAEKDQIKKRVIYESKLFTSYLDHTFKDLLHKQECVKSLPDCYETLKIYRKKYVRPINLLSSLSSTDIIDAFNFSDEYLSNRVMLLLLQLKISDEEKKQVLLAEVIYRQEYLKNAPKIDRNRDVEFYRVHLSRLKDYIFKSLFLRLKEIKTEKIYKNLFASIAAAFAAVFANLTRVEQFQGAQDFGLKFYTLFAIAVLAYVFKDRIKDYVKEYFNAWFKDRVPDREFKILYKSIPKQGDLDEQVLGKVKEYFKFNDLGAIPCEIKYLKQIIEREDRSVKAESSVIHYRKRIEIDPGSSKGTRQANPGFIDQFLINTNDFLPHLGDPNKSFIIPDENGQSRSVETSKSYYFDLLLRISVQDAKGSRKERLEAIRLVVNKLGILRMKDLVPEKKFLYEVNY
ncbi:MAG: hypothetical protein AB8G05_24860 [Oligoflexales bacterium]